MKLSTGKEIDPNGGFIGLNEEFELSEGYDDTFTLCPLKSYEDYCEPTDPYVLTIDEQIELSYIMTKRWQDFRKHVLESKETHGKA